MEYELLKEIKHHNLLQLYDVYQTQRYLVLITPRYFGGDLLKHLTRLEKYNELQVMRYVKQILGALDYLHSRNIAHLDLRHDNILLASRRKDVIRIIDMGSAVRLNSDEEAEGMVVEPDTIPEFLGEYIVYDSGERGIIIVHKCIHLKERGSKHNVNDRKLLSTYLYWFN